MNTMYGSATLPRQGDYIQLLDQNNEPCENHAEVSRWTAELGINLFLVEDVQGESFAVTRLSEMDTDRRNAWQEVVTAAPNTLGKPDFTKAVTSRTGRPTKAELSVLETWRELYSQGMTKNIPSLRAVRAGKTQ